MTKKLYFLISFVLLLSVASVSYGAPTTMKLDFNNQTDNNEPNTEVGWTGFTLRDNGSDVCGITIDLLGVLRNARRQDPNTLPNGPGYPIWHERIYRDFIYTLPGGMTITLWGLGAGQTCDINLYAYDYRSEPNRMCDWYVNEVTPGNLIFTTRFLGMDTTKLPSEWIYASEHTKYSYTATVTADTLGRIILIGTWNAQSPRGKEFCFVNGLDVKPHAPYIIPLPAQRPEPYDEEEDIPVDTVLSWRASAYADTHDVYLGTSYAAVNSANHASAEWKGNQAGTTYDPYADPGLLKVGQTYYWRIDEVNNAPAHTEKGEVWSFTTETCAVIDDFDTYTSDQALYSVWVDGYSNELSSSEVTRSTYATTIPATTLVHSGYAMKFVFHNYTWPRDYGYPTYSEATATLGTGVNQVLMDPDWLGMGAKSLSIWFRGTATNDITEPMYIKLVDSAAASSKVTYDGPISDIAVELWKEWVIDLSSFSGVNLHSVSKIIIGVGDATQSASDGTVYFDDLSLCASRCVLQKRPAALGLVDYAPGGLMNGDCSIDYLEMAQMASTWLAKDNTIPTKNPGTTNLTALYKFDEGSGKTCVNSAPGAAHPATDANLSQNDPNETRERIVEWVTPGAVGGGAAAHFAGLIGERVNAKRWDPVAGNNHNMTLAIWAKWAGRHLDREKCQGLISKRNGWDNASVYFMFEVDTTPGPRGTFALRQYNGAQSVYAPQGLLNSFIGQWVHLAAVVNNDLAPTDANRCRLYLNATQVTNGPFQFGGGNPANIDLTIGQISDLREQGTESFMGDLDEAYIYNRVLEVNEIGYLADRTPEDGILYIAVPSAAEVYTAEATGSRRINFKDFALVANKWLEGFIWP